MDNFQELFDAGDNWQGGCEGRGIGPSGGVTSADSTTPPPQHVPDEKDDKKNANSIRGLNLKEIIFVWL